MMVDEKMNRDNSDPETGENRNTFKTYHPVMH